MLASTKHFLADGGTADGRDQGDARIDEATLRSIHGRPYGPAIDAGVATVMTSFSSWNGLKIAANRGLVTDLLKGRMGFDGFVVTDWNAHGQLPGCTNASCPVAINAGVDMYMAPDSWKPLYHSLLAQAKDGTVPMARLDDAVTRILRVKMRLGLFEAGKPSSRPLAGKWDLLGAPAHRALAREAVGQVAGAAEEPGRAAGEARCPRAGGGRRCRRRGARGGRVDADLAGHRPVAHRFPGCHHHLEAASAKGRGRCGRHRDAERRRPFHDQARRGDRGVRRDPLCRVPGRPEDAPAPPRAARADRHHAPAEGAGGAGGGGDADRPAAVRRAGAEPCRRVRRRVAAGQRGGRRRRPADRAARRGGAGLHRANCRCPWPATARADGPVLWPLGYGLAGHEAAGQWKPVPEDPGVADDDAGGVFMADGVAAAGWSLLVEGAGDDTTRIASVPATGAGGRVRVTAVDARVQEGARQFAFRGGGAQLVALAAQSPLDLSRQANGDVMLVATMRFDTPPAADAAVIARCAGGCSGAVPLRSAGTTTGRFQNVGVPLKCFGGDLSATAVPFAVRSTGSMRFTLAGVALGTTADRVLACR